MTPTARGDVDTASSVGLALPGMDLGIGSASRAIGTRTPLTLAMTQAFRL